MYDHAVKHQMKSLGNGYLRNASKRLGLEKLDKTKSWQQVKKEKGLERRARTKKIIQKINELESEAKLRAIKERHIRNVKGNEDLYLEAVYAKLDLLKTGGHSKNDSKT